MKRKILFAVALLATMTAAAQNIAAVSPSNATTIYQTLEEAIVGAESGSTIYLPGGGFQISDETKINKKLTIMGVSHRGDTDNVDGATVIGGNLHFEEGSSGSAILGIYVSGNINVGTQNDPVTNFTVRYCNVNSIQVKNSQSSGMIVNQSYLRSHSCFGHSNVKITNCVIASIEYIDGGTISDNVCVSCISNTNYRRFMRNVFNSNITRNIFNYEGVEFDDHKNIVNKNYGAGRWDIEPIVINTTSISDLFKNWNNGAISPASNFHFKDEYKQYENQVGIYAGDRFSDDKSLAPIPRIISKKVSESTDASGKLQIVVKVKAQ